ncbi:MAG: RagB/SusD family nutrient uptake outer membrane protein [Candidatus Ordinivivax streblomastigis]|uniref:RagB/SusD family nutrient uptake outer membrane protein n=1 Tax=Candidatus Ordinivivax streblomastigis TaxID=2540710 RepID=A0A5M8P5F0_9BACT|nr:MAG: RagB/SusD family nutrient uptake outer membrane protein [Candidatus Ordinivivax streblomastigis]
MKKTLYKLLAGCCCLSGLWLTTGCNSFESEPLDLNREERVLNPNDSTDNPAVKRLFYACYLNVPNLHNRLSSSYLDAATDDALPTATANPNLNYFRNGLISASNIATTFGDGTAWASSYQGIRYVNLFLSKVGLFPPSKQVPEYYIKQMKSEARLLRAYYYFEMLKRWGGVPLLGDRVLSADDDLNIPRNSIQEVADYITNELSPDIAGSCYADLHPAQSIADDEDPDNSGNMIGHVNQGVALGLLSRLHLYLASDLYNENKDIAKWQTAASWAKRLIDLNVYALYDNAAKPAAQFAVSGSSEFPNREVIMVKLTSSPSIGPEKNNAPQGFFYSGGSDGLVVSSGHTSPSQNLVDAFLTLDGKSIYNNYDPKQGYTAEYDPQAPYTNRDPRLNRFIFLNGSRWLSKPVETFIGGAHNGAQQNAVYTRTGYYLKKFLGNNEYKSQYDNLYHHYQIIRYAEILLNYAEAVNESDPTNYTEIERGIIALRQRAGITPGDDNRYGLPATYDQTLMRNIIRNERRIELCFEEHRFWDVRRWKIAEDVLAQPVRGVNIIQNEDGTFTYNYGDAYPSSSFLPYMYWYPIPRNELYGNKALIQNLGWSY